MAANHTEIEKRLWDAADELRANSKLKSSEYAIPVLGLIFLRYADHKFTVAEKELAAETAASTPRRRTIGKTDYQAKGVMYLPEKARYSYLLSRPEGTDIGRAINDAMKAIEEENDDLKGILPKTYSAFDNSLLVTLLKTFAAIPMDIEGDVFGRVYEYFIGEFARAEGQKGGEDYTPTAVVKLIVEIIEPYHGRIYDPACGAGGMFVQSGKFVQAHSARTPSPSPLPVGEGATQERVRVRSIVRVNADPITEISVYGQERVTETVRLAKMNLAVHGLSGEIREGNTYYEDIHTSVGRFDFTMANPPFNVDRIDKDRLAKDPRFPFGLPRTDNGNYLWIQIFYSALNATGRAGFVMANSASDARASELEIRRKLIATGAVDVMVAIGSNMFYNVTLPATLWFMDKAKTKLPPCPPSPPGPSPTGRGESEGRGEGAQLRRGTEHYRGGFDFGGLVETARELRKKQTPAEELMWELLRDRRFNGLKFRRQHQLRGYIVDFYCHERQLVIEVDGPVHEAEQRRKHDHKRDAFLQSLGYKVVRFTNDQVLNETEKVLTAIAEAAFPLLSCAPSPQPSPTGRGSKGEGLPNSEGLPKRQRPPETGARYRDTVLFIDARHIFRQIDRAHRDFTPEQIEYLANIVRLYRGECPEFTAGGENACRKLLEVFAKPSPQPSPTGRGRDAGAGEGGPAFQYRDVSGLCKVATIAEIEKQGWSLNPGRYVGVGERPPDDFVFAEKLEELNEELETLNAEARELEDRIAENVTKLLET